MTFKVRKSGAFADPTIVRRREGGAWVTPQTIKRRSGGTWVTVWSAYVAPVVAMPDVYDYRQGQIGTIQGGISVLSDGTWDAVGGQGGGAVGGTWLTAGNASDVEVYASVTGGSGASWSGSMNAWVTGGLSVILSKSTNGTSYGTINLTFRNKTTQAQLDTATISVELYRGTPL